MNMFKKIKPTNVKEYLDSIPKDREETVLFLHNFIQKKTPKLKPHFAYNMLGYGSFPYRNYKKELIQWPIVALANQKNYISLYVCAVDHNEYIAEKYKKDLGRVSVGKSCIRFKKITDLNLSVLEEIIKFAEKQPGLVGAGKSKKQR